MLILNDGNVKDSIKKGNFLLMFYSGGCPLCPRIIEILQTLERAENGKFKFAVLKFDGCPEAVKTFNVPCVPTVLAVSDGKVLQGRCELADEEAYKKIINEVFPAP